MSGSTSLGFLAGMTLGLVVLALAVEVSALQAQVIKRVAPNKESTATTASSRQALERERKRLEADVALTAKLIAQSQATQQRSLGEVRLLDRQIALRRRLLETNEQEIDALEEEIDDLEALVGAMRSDVTTLQRSYGKLAVLSYKLQNRHSTFLWLLASDDFAQAYDRLMYLREMQRLRRLQIGLVRRAKGRLDQQLAEIEAAKNSKQDLLIARKTEKQRLDTNRAQKTAVVQQLKVKQSEYQQQLSAYRSKLAAVQRDIERLIREEIDRAARAEAAARARATRAGRATTADANTIAERDNLKRLSALFERNQGKLPWPLPPNRSVVTSTFGINEDPSGARVQNDGVFLRTESEQPIRAVFNGKVTHVRSNRVIGTVVIIQHGAYRSVYVNLSNVLVKEGEEVSTLQTIGTYAPKDEGSAELQFLIYNNRTPVDPLKWIVPKN